MVLHDDSVELCRLLVVSGEKLRMVWQIAVQCSDGEIVQLRMDWDAALVENTKAALTTHTGVPMERQRLSFRGQLMEDGALTDYGFTSGDTLQLQEAD